MKKLVWLIAIAMIAFKADAQFTMSSSSGTAVVGAISGTLVVCVGNNTTLSDTTVGGLWSSADTSIATISGAGVVHGVAAGTDTLFYIKGTDSAFAVVTVNPLPFAGTITGTASICIGSSDTFTSSVSGGSWWLANGNATDTPMAHIAKGITAGRDTMYYAVSNTCGTDTTWAAFTENPLASAGSIYGSGTVCVGAVDTLGDSTSIGMSTWTMTNGNATIDSMHHVWGVNAGLDTVKLVVSNSCGMDSTWLALTVNPLPLAGTVFGIGHVCVGATDTLTDTTFFGTGSWTATNTNATLAPLGTSQVIVSGMHTGTDSVKFTASNSCGTVTTGVLITVNPLPAHGTIFGDSSVCVHSYITFGDSTSLGTAVWALYNGNASMDSTPGLVRGEIAGMDTIRILVSNSCGTDTAWKTFMVNPLPSAGTIAASAVVCQGGMTMFTASVSGGTWSIFDTTYATVSDSGVVMGIMPGADTIKYKLSNMCGSDSTWFAFSVNPMPHAGVIAGAGTVCAGGTDTLIDTVAMGLWSSMDVTIAAVSSTGVVSGISSGTTAVQYWVSNSCGADSAAFTITINPGAYVTQIGSLTGSDSVCVGGTITLLDTVIGGVWHSGNESVLHFIHDSTVGGFVSASLLAGVSGGYDTVWYRGTNSCGSDSAYTVIKVISKPSHSIISGLHYACVGRAADTLSDATPNGTWTATNTNATVGATSGIVIGMVPGTKDTVIYSSANICGTTHDTMVVNIPTAWACDSINAVPMINENAAGIKVYPNPSTGVFAVEFNGNGNEVTAQLVDMYGRIIETHVAVGLTNFTFGTGDIASGNYILTVTADGKTYREKIIIY
jgi:Secretion system C-terminal sorting domain